jgi:hypothetical protein
MSLKPADNGLDHSRRGWMPEYAITIQVVTTLLLAIRLTSRINRIGASVGLDDVLILFAWLFGLALTVLIVYCEFLHGANLGGNLFIVL